jgi:murein DD-endopeptidase MepM/ murein hydrolase activator NlpD
MSVRSRIRGMKAPLCLALAACFVLCCAAPGMSSGGGHRGHGRRAERARAEAASPLEVMPTGATSRGVAPVAAPHGRLASDYGYRMSPRSRRRKFHAGVDFEAPRGVAVRSVGAGYVEAVPLNRERDSGFGGYGNAVVVRHPDDGVWVLYAHLDSTSVRAGDRVTAGQLLGRVGRTSNRRFPSMAPHLHMEVRHATEEGLSPFPGRYRRDNLNPACWLASRGLHYDRRGALASPSEAAPLRCGPRVAALTARR